MLRFICLYYVRSPQAAGLTLEIVVDYEAWDAARLSDARRLNSNIFYSFGLPISRDLLRSLGARTWIGVLLRKEFLLNIV